MKILNKLKELVAPKKGFANYADIAALHEECEKYVKNIEPY